MTLNTRVRPFDDERVRRAVNFAVDRAEMVDIFGGPNLASETCQVLPPNFPSYEPYCFYTSGPSAQGEWRGPDLERARRLVAASGTGGMRITVWVANFFPSLGDYFVSLLRDLGYASNLKSLGDEYFNTISDSRTRAQISAGGWYPDYPRVSSSRY